MKKLLSFALLAILVGFTSCKKDSGKIDIPENLPRTNVPAELKGPWMYGNFSTTEYFNQNPANYLGNALEIAVAFNFEENGTYTQYFTSSSVLAGVSTYQQSVSKGTVEIDQTTKTIKTYPASAHYKRTRSNQVLEERDMLKSELSAPTSYTYSTSLELNGTKALTLAINGTSPLKFLKK